MATSSNFGTSNQYIVYNIVVNVNSQNIANNTSNITTTVNIWRTNTGYTTYGNGTVTCTINGTTVSASINNSQTITSSTRTILTDSGRNITHNSDGTKTITVSASISHDRFSSSGTGSFNVTLPTIPRTSSFSSSKYTYSFNEQCTVNISRASSSFTHDAYYQFGNTTIKVASGATTSFTFTFPNSLMDQIPSATSGYGTLTVHTMNGGTYIGNNTARYTLNVPSSIVPTLSSVSLSRTNDSGVPSGWTEYVKNLSTVKATISASGTYGSSISSYSISGTGISGTSNSNTVSSKTTAAGTITITAKVTDTRGRTATKTASITVQDYEPPKISSFTAVRCNSSGATANNGTYLKCIASYSYSSVNSKNSITVKKISVKASDESSFSDLNTSVASGTSYLVGSGKISASKSYICRFTLTDGYKTSTYDVNISTESTTMDFLNGGNGICFGGVATQKNLFECQWLAQFTKAINIGSLDNFLQLECTSSKALTRSGFTVMDTGTCPVIKSTSSDGVIQYSFRFTNGVQINWMGKTCSTAIDTAWGSIYCSVTKNDLPNYVQAFISPPTVIKAVEENKGRNAFLNGGAKATTTWPGGYEFLRGNAVGGDTAYNIQVLSIGLWKNL